MEQIKFGKKCREHMVNEVSNRLANYSNYVVTHFSHLKVTDIESMRSSVKKVDGNFIIVKNAIARLALKKAGIEKLNELIQGPCAIAYNRQDPPGLCRILFDFKKANETFKIDGGILEGKKVGPEQIKEMALLPPKEILLAMAVGTIKAPITNFVGGLAAFMRNLVGVVNAIKEKKEEK